MASLTTEKRFNQCADSKVDLDLHRADREVDTMVHISVHTSNIVRRLAKSFDDRARKG